jgi:hypothetical protein
MWQRSDVSGISQCRNADGVLTFRVRQRDGTYIGSSPSKAEAVQLLKDNDIEVVFKRNPQLELAIWHEVYPQFQGWRPTDVVSLEDAVTHSSYKELTEYPLIFHIFLRSKESEFRQMWLQWFGGLSDARKHLCNAFMGLDSDRVDKAAALVHGALGKTAKGMKSVDRTWANRNLNYGMSHHHGFISLALGLSVMQKASRASSQTFSLGDPDVFYELLPYQADCATQYTELFKVQVVLNTMPVAEDFECWESAFSTCSKTLKVFSTDAGAIADLSKYAGRWGLRKTLIGKRMCNNASSFKIPPKLSIKRFAKLFPDQCEYVTRWAKFLKVRTMQQLVSKLRFKDSLEFLTMFTCLIGDSRLRSQEVATLKKVRPTITKFKRLSRNSQGHVGHPACVYADAIKAAK